MSNLALGNFWVFLCSSFPNLRRTTSPVVSMADQANENTCVVCFKNVLYYSIGECDHPVCFECSTRMRVLCLQNECPICRQDLSRVVFTDSIQPYKELRNRVFTDRLFERQFKIGFCNETIKQMYESLLENRCNICDNQTPFRNFTMLSDHMRKVHEKYYCDLCVKHLKIFTNERKCYTRQELAHHRRKGDLDDTSHRGHPLCEFCEERFMDADELYRHLRKEHLYCHLCDADGKNLYYPSHAALIHHFRTDHFLCEEGDCARNEGQHLTAVFRSEIDLKAHKATVHGRGLTRGAARQARTLELQFNITPHAVLTARPPRERVERPPSPPAPPPAPRIDTHSVEQFPRLSAAPAQPHLLVAAPRAYQGTQNLARTDKNFPTLGGAAPAPRAPAPSVAATILRNSKPGVSIQLASKPASASNFRLQQTSAARISAPRQRPFDDEEDDDDFPALSRDDHPSIGAGTLQPPKVAMINSEEMQALRSGASVSQQRKPALSAEAFPALSRAAPAAAPPQWITVNKAKDKRPARPEPPPREPVFNPVADFPTLPVNAKNKNKRQPQPQPQPPPPRPAPVAETKPKKDKKKQNGKKENGDVPLVNGLDKKYARDPSLTDVNENDTVPEPKIKTVSVDRKNRNAQGEGDFALASKDYPPLSAPPGFKARPACDGMTFTNSSGQTFPAPVHAYIPPPDFEKRNRELFKKFTVALGGPTAVEQFKVASRAFREGLTSAEEFYSHCRGAMGEKLDAVFPDLVALLPDIARQQELAAGRGARRLHTCAACGQLLAPADAAAHRAAHAAPH